MVRVELIFHRIENPLIAINMPRVPCVGEEVEFGDDYADSALAGRAFAVKQVSFQVAAPDAESVPLLVVGDY